MNLYTVNSLVWLTAISFAIVMAPGIAMGVYWSWWDRRRRQLRGAGELPPSREPGDDDRMAA